MDIQRFPKSKTRILYIGVWVLLFAISVWMYINEGRYLHLMSMRLTAAEENFEVSVLAGEKRVQAFSGEDNTQTEQFQAQMGEREALLVRGSLPADNSVRQTELFFLYDDNAAKGTWTIMGSEGTERIDYSKTDMEHPGRFLYLLIPLLFALSCGGLPVFTGSDDRKAAVRLLQIIGEAEGGQETLKAGERWIKRNWKPLERDKNLFGICVTAESLVMIRGLWHSGAFVNPYPRLFQLAVFLIMTTAGLYLRHTLFAMKDLKILTKENRPMTAAAAFLMEISNGGEFRPRRRVLFHNAAAGLCHAGLYEPALKAEELSVSKRESAFWIYIHGNIRFACLYHLARWEEAAREDAELREILRENPGLTKRKSVQTAIFSMKIKAAIMKQDEKKAQAYLELYREQQREDYDILEAVLWEAEIHAKNGDMDKAQELYNYLLRFSPENMAVRKAQEHGGSAYREPERLWKREKSGILVSGLLALISAMFMTVMLVYCLEGIPAFGTRSVWNASEKPMPPESTGQPQESSAQSPESVSEKVSVGQFSFELPSDWTKMAVAEICEDGNVIVYERRSHEIMGGGELFGIIVMDDGAYINLPDYHVWGYDEEAVYVMWQPTDVTFCLENEDIQRDYQRMSRELERVRETFRIHSEEARYDGDEFVFPNSDTCYLEESCLWNLSGEQLRIARNEIYARHGRLFIDEELQRHFENCSWYEGKFAPADFSEGLLNEYERANILLMQQYSEEKQP